MSEAEDHVEEHEVQDAPLEWKEVQVKRGIVYMSMQ